MMKLIKVGKGFSFFCLLLIGALGCREREEDKVEIYLQISFEDGFAKDVVDVYLYDILIVNKDTLNTGFSDGVTSTVIYIMRKNDEYIAKNRDVEVLLGSIDNVGENLSFNVILNGEEQYFKINPLKGKYIGFNRSNGVLQISQSHNRPMYD